MLDILVLDDCKVAQAELHTILTTLNKDYTIYPCYTYYDALKVVKTHHIDVAFIDLQMPGPNGADLIVDLNRSSRRDYMKLVVLTATDQNSLLATSLRNHVDEYLPKGVDIEVIGNVLTRLTAHSGKLNICELRKEYGDHLNTIFAIYKAENDETLSDLLHAKDCGDLAAMTACVHKLYGSSKVVRHFPLVDLCGRIECDLRNGLFTEADIDLLEKEYVSFSNYLGSFLKS